MALGLTVGHGGSGCGPSSSLPLSRALDLNMATGLGYDSLDVVSPSSYSGGVGPLVLDHTGSYVAKPENYPAGLSGARIDGSTPAWDDGSGNALSGITWAGKLPEETNLLAYSSDPTSGHWNTATGITYVAPWSQARGSFSAYKLDGTIPVGRYEIGVIIKKVSSSGVIAVVNPQNTPWGHWTIDTALLSTGENWVTRHHPAVTVVNNFTGTPSGGAIWFNVASGSPEFDFRAVTIVTGSAAPGGPIETSGATLARAAETAEFTSAIIGYEFSVVATLDYSAGLPAAEQDIVAIGADKFSVTTLGKAKVTDGTLTTTSTAATTAATGRKVGFARSPSGSLLRIDSTIETGAAAVAWVGDTDLAIGGPIQRLQIWTRALSLAELTAA